MINSNAMVLPRNAVLMDVGEMRYTEGGLTRKYTKNQSYNNYVLMAAAGYTAGTISLVAGGAKSKLVKIIGASLGGASTISASKWTTYQKNFKKAGTKKNGCKVNFKSLTNWSFTYL